MQLLEILSGVEFELIKGNCQMDISGINYDSRLVEKSQLFICIEGYATDGHKYIDDAVKNGAAAIIVMRDLEKVPDCTVIKVKDTRKTMALAGANFYGHPADKMKIIGITGTNGKTTSTYMMKSILENAGYKVGLIGSISNYIGHKKLVTHRTTPESLELQKLFKQMVDENVKYCVMEVSSHSLYLDRVYGVKFSQGIFTNLTQDHLDFHKTFENYYNAKLILFKNSLNSIINIDDGYGVRVFHDVKGNKTSYAIDKEADVKGSSLIMHSRGVEFDMEYKQNKSQVKLNIPGKYNVMNALGSAAACLMEDIDFKTVVQGLEKMEFVPGRCEIVTKKYNLPFEVIVDFAHTPDGLENILKTAREFTKGRLISVFGCGGDRDRTKRPIMGKIGSELSDIAIVTSDNPRTEEPMEIIKEVAEGIKTNNCHIIENRKEAIKAAMEMAKKDDVIVVAGKGHEDYQILKDKTIHFDEREIIADIVKELNL
ncbi:MAG: UDP-N-acetylmuramoyl-L-alanyl-D-glutamate--2,6-diaminopimelate ligase [Clostridiaceae bacterium]|jgi:UDP-N-acetylmuramoyl-L-alanyl-D-glutamate--2,6-diaminopimelate ligase|nr:UDP-N-acetylmuramoyl-L-alanyl-D-glutamate--2,6-diaminopimelate ligase [Clostridiaceae bacterium]